MLAAPTWPTSGSTSSNRGSTARLRGIVNDSPRHSGPSPATSSGSRASSHSMASYDQGRPRAAYAARCSTGLSEWATGLPRTAQRRAALTGRSPPRHGVLALSSFLNSRNSAYEEVNLVSPVDGLTVTKYSQSPSSGARAACRATSPGEPIGPGGSPLLA